VAQRQRQGFLASVTWVRVSAWTPVTPAVSYLPTGHAGYSVGPGISCGACKLVRTPRIKKKKIEYLIFYVKEIKNKKMAQLMDRAKFT
jgi:hypothetical protein